MPAPGALLDLGLTLHPAHPVARQEQAAVLASRLGYGEIWLPLGGDLGWPDPSHLDALARAAGAADLGLIMRGSEDETVAGLLRLTVGAGAHALLELPSASAGLVRAVGGASAWQARVRLRTFDPTAAGTVVEAASRAALRAAVADVVSARRAAGLDPGRHPVAASLPVAIGRTWSEAEARALRDPRFEADAHPRERGLFGTYEHAQSQVLDLAAAGADALRVTVADEVDVADLLAQIRSVVVGATPVLHARRH
jgi:hypothetical protein